MEDFVTRELSNIDMFHGDIQTPTPIEDKESIFIEDKPKSNRIDLQLTKSEVEDLKEEPIEKSTNNTITDEEYQQILQLLQEQRKEKETVESQEVVKEVKKKKAYFGSEAGQESSACNGKGFSSFFGSLLKDNTNEEIEESTWNWRDIGIGAVTGLLLGSAMLSRPSRQVSNNYVF